MHPIALFFFTSLILCISSYTQGSSLFLEKDSLDSSSTILPGFSVNNTDNQATWQENEWKIIHDAAVDYIDRFLNDMTAKTYNTNPLYRMWFESSPTRANYNALIANLQIVQREIVSATPATNSNPTYSINFGTCAANDLGKSIFRGRIFANKIILCPKLWKSDSLRMGLLVTKANNKSPKSRATTLLHEWIHAALTIAKANGDVEVYPPAECLELPYGKTAQALRNPNSYKFYVESMPADIQLTSVKGGKCAYNYATSRLECENVVTIAATYSCSNLTQGTLKYKANPIYYLSVNSNTKELIHSTVPTEFTFRYTGGGAYRIVAVASAGSFTAGDLYIDGFVPKVNTGYSYKDYEAFVQVSVNTVESQVRITRIEATGCPFIGVKGASPTKNDNLYCYGTPIDFTLIGPYDKFVIRAAYGLFMSWTWINGWTYLSESPDYYYMSPYPWESVQIAASGVSYSYMKPDSWWDAPVFGYNLATYNWNLPK